MPFAGGISGRLELLAGVVDELEGFQEARAVSVGRCAGGGHNHLIKCGADEVNAGGDVGALAVGFKCDSVVEAECDFPLTGKMAADIGDCARFRAFEQGVWIFIFCASAVIANRGNESS